MSTRSLPKTEVWAFTFGYGQRLVPSPHFAEDPEPAGLSLKDMYVLIAGTYESARDEMIRRFGRTWSFQYPFDSDFERQINEYGLTELAVRS